MFFCAKGMKIYSLSALGLALSLLLVPILIHGTPSRLSTPDTAIDVYYKTQGTPSDRGAPLLTEKNYPSYSVGQVRLSNRQMIWSSNQQHIYFASFVLAMPVYALLLEVIGVFTRDRRFDRLAKELMKIGMASYAIAAFLGGLLLISFCVLYPDFFLYIAHVFQPLMPLYVLLFGALTTAFYIYYYSWDRLQSSVFEKGLPLEQAKWLHLTLSVLLNAWGYLLLILTNAWLTFMMSPAGVDEKGRSLGNLWHVIHTTLWHPANAHRFLTNGVFGGGIMAAYAAYRFLKTDSPSERAYYDWMGQTALFLTALFLLPQPFIGYWFARTAYAYSQQMGLALMGDTLGWWFIVVAVLFGMMIMGMTYYLWLSMNRLNGSERYTGYVKYLIIVLGAAFAVWITPHNYLMTLTEILRLKETYHPVVGSFGTMSAKNGAANMMIMVMILSYLMHQRCSRRLTLPWKAHGNALLTAFFIAGGLNLVYLSIYGYFIPSNIQAALSLPLACTTLSCIIMGIALNRAVLQRAEVLGSTRWGQISPRSQYALLFLGVAFTWLMGLMGYVRSSSRLSWHVYKIFKDASSDALTQSLGTVTNVVSTNVIVSLLTFILIFWVSGRDGGVRRHV